MDAPLHDDLSPLAGLIGSWSGRGTGSYPTIEDFAYLEELTFGHVGKPFVSMVQRTREPDTGAPMHTETGYLRMPVPDTVELMVAQPIGLVEIGLGSVTVEGPCTRLRVRTTVTTTPSAKDVREVERTVTWDNEELTYELSMSAVGHPMTHHLAARLRRR
jgi:hypothetical protein